MLVSALSIDHLLRLAVIAALNHSSVNIVVVECENAIVKCEV